MNKISRSVIGSLIIFFSLFTIVKTFYYSSFSGGTDLRNIVVGSRLMAKGYSPYFYKWNPTDGERLLDPNDGPSRLVNGTTVTPAVLFILYPLTGLTYPQIRLLWTILQLLAVVTIFYLMLKRYKGSDRIIPGDIVLLGLLASDYWFFHVERGQKYIFFVLIFALMYFSYTSKKKYGEFLSGFIGGLFIFFRPFAVIIILGFLCRKKFKWVKGNIIGILVGVLLFVVTNPGLWKDYYHAMTEYGNICLNKGHTLNAFPHQVLPSVIEGASNLTVIGAFKVSNLPAMYGYVIKAGIQYTPVISYFTCGIIATILSLFFFKKGEPVSNARLFLFSYLLYCMVELFILNWRSPYNLIEWVFPLFLIVEEIEHKTTQMILLIVALSCLHMVPFYFHFQTAIGEFLLIFLIFYIVYSDGFKYKLSKSD